MYPYTLPFLAGHSDFATTKRYVHPQIDTVRTAIEKAREARTSARIGQSGKKMAAASGRRRRVKLCGDKELSGAPGVTRTPDLLVRSQTLYPTELRAQRVGLFSIYRVGPSSATCFRSAFVLNDPAPVTQTPIAPRPMAWRHTAARSPGR